MGSRSFYAYNFDRPLSSPLRRRGQQRRAVASCDVCRDHLEAGIERLENYRRGETKSRYLIFKGQAQWCSEIRYATKRHDVTIDVGNNKGRECVLIRLFYLPKLAQKKEKALEDISLYVWTRRLASAHCWRDSPRRWLYARRRAVYAAHVHAAPHAHYHNPSRDERPRAHRTILYIYVMCANRADVYTTRAFPKSDGYSHGTTRAGTQFALCFDSVRREEGGFFRKCGTLREVYMLTM